ncbi:hypothetical protein [Microtetraspora sp. NBRC 16547]|uniref:DUF6941 family protein n=1 Tax=Microtetraspora sp. NBRC 16547 TaxID=3030993 RepID=UPI0024A13803|nr:hypothetical protein [Microtetraspora sp. NBRC 16547]GLW96698.1 hypothetical protein Misp02_07850 [Microtetraspora sp. NBRC 16547]
MKAFIMLCDSAQRDHVTGKMHMLGADWSLTDSAAPQMAVAVFLRFSWEEASASHFFALRLVDDAGKSVMAPVNGEDRPVEYQGELGNVSVGADDFVRMTDIHSSFAVNVAPLPLGVGRRYEWKLDIDDQEFASADFAIRHPVPVEEGV